MFWLGECAVEAQINGFNDIGPHCNLEVKALEAKAAQSMW